jgi:hypothetical protein
VTLSEIQQLFADAHCVRLYAKQLAKNDNSKQQIYFGSGFETINILPSYRVEADSRKDSRPKFKTKLDFGWLSRNGNISKAPGAQLILYPQYPEVRFSGFLRGCDAAPSRLMRKRQSGRVLFLGITASERVVGFVVGATSEAAQQFRSQRDLLTNGVFVILEIPKLLSESRARDVLLRELARISKKGWIRSKQLDGSGRVRSCNAPQCGGFTLEAELGVAKNSKSEPDFHGWEVKQYGVKNLKSLDAGKITLMTPEPTGGYYKQFGPIAFVYKFGCPDKKGRVGRHNFTGVHRCEIPNGQTKLTLRLVGYDKRKNVITSINGALRLIDADGTVAASWNFSRLMTHWTRKHARAAYVPSVLRTEPDRRYRYGNRIRLASRTDFSLFLKAITKRLVYYDPGIKVEKSSGRPVAKLRNQFRVISRDIASLYHHVTTVTL